MRNDLVCRGCGDRFRLWPFSPTPAQIERRDLWRARHREHRVSYFIPTP